MNSVATAWRAYRGEPPAARLHVLVRALTCPFGPLLDCFPTRGSVLDVGCGHGLLVNLLARDPSRCGLRLAGIDHDAEKIATARRTAIAGVDFSTRPLASLPESAYDAVAMFDVLYTVGRGAWGGILGECFRVLRPGGKLIIKEVVDRPRWKYWAVMAQESLSVRVLRITKGEPPHFESPDGYRAAIEQAGFSALEDRALYSASWVGHHLFLARRA